MFHGQNLVCLNVRRRYYHLKNTLCFNPLPPWDRFLALSSHITIPPSAIFSCQAPFLALPDPPIDPSDASRGRVLH